VTDSIGGVDAVWIVIGLVILAFTLLDAFLAVLNYNEAGIYANRVVRWEWVAIRALTRRISRRWRPIVLRQVTGILIVTTLLCWIVGLVVGFAFIYLGLIGFGLFQISDGVTPNFVGAFYLSVGQFSTAGADNISPGGGWVNVIPVAEALLSVVMISFFITFLSNIYSVIQNLRSWCGDFFQVGTGIGSAVEALRPFFPAGRPRGLDMHLTFMVNDFSLYADSLRQDRGAYHFQSGEDRFSLPYALYMTSGVIGALQWGLPADHPASQSPEIIRLIEAFIDFRDQRSRVMRWRVPVPLSPLTRDEFDEQWIIYRSRRLDAHPEQWAARFFALNEAMAQLADAGDQGSGDQDGDDAYSRYVGWLAFAYPAAQFVTDISRDLDYQPIYREDPVVSGPEPAVAPDVAASPRPRDQHGIGAWLRRRQIFLDPGFMRLRAAVRTLAIVVAAVALAVGAAAVFSFSVPVAGALAGLVAMFASAPSGGNQRVMRRWGLVGLVPVAAGIACGLVLPHDSFVTIIGLAVIAALATWLARFGPIAVSAGRLFFIVSFFAVVLAVTPAQSVAAFVAAGLGVVCCWVASFVPTRSSQAQLRGVWRAFGARTSSLLDATIDVLSTGTAGVFEKRLDADALALAGTGSHLGILLDPEVPPAGMSSRRTQALRLRVLEVELAAQALLRALPHPNDSTVPVDVRSALASELVALQHHARERGSRAQPYAVHAVPRPDWTDGAHRALDAIGELAAAFDLLHETQIADERALPVDTALPDTGIRPSTAPGSALAGRRAVQSAVSVGLTLFLGGFVSVGAQYWAALPAFQNVATASALTWGRNLRSAISTVAAAAASFALTLWTNHNPVVALAVLIVSVFLTAFLRAVASSWTVFWQTVLLATMYDTLSVFDVEAVHVRIAETAIGAVIALLVSALVLPTRTRAHVMKRMSETVTAAMNAVHAAMRSLAEPGSVDSATAANLESDTTRQLHAIQAAARPVRDASGSLERGGIEAQLMALWALLYYVRRLVTADVGDAARAITPGQWQRLDAYSRDNFHAALAVLDDRLPQRVHDVHALTASVQSAAERELLADIRRINEVLLAYMDDIVPGSSTQSVQPITSDRTPNANMPLGE
jgi:hypothetical protein